MGRRPVFSGTWRPSPTTRQLYRVILIFEERVQSHVPVSFTSSPSGFEMADPIEPAHFVRKLRNGTRELVRRSVSTVPEVFAAFAVSADNILQVFRAGIVVKAKGVPKVFPEVIFAVEIGKVLDGSENDEEIGLEAYPRV